MLRPIESLLLLQLSFMIKCHVSYHPLSPTYCFSLHISLCLCVLLLLFVGSVILFSFSPLSTFSSFPPFQLAVCTYFSAQLSLTPNCRLCNILLFHTSYLSLQYSKIFLCISYHFSQCDNHWLAWLSKCRVVFITSKWFGRFMECSQYLSSQLSSLPSNLWDNYLEKTWI